MAVKVDGISSNDRVRVLMHKIARKLRIRWCGVLRCHCRGLKKLLRETNVTRQLNENIQQYLCESMDLTRHRENENK